MVAQGPDAMSPRGHMCDRRINTLKKPDVSTTFDSVKFLVTIQGTTRPAQADGTVYRADQLLTARLESAFCAFAKLWRRYAVLFTKRCEKWIYCSKQSHCVPPKLHSTNFPKRTLRSLSGMPERKPMAICWSLSPKYAGILVILISEFRRRNYGIFSIKLLCPIQKKLENSF